MRTACRVREGRRKRVRATTSRTYPRTGLGIWERMGRHSVWETFSLMRGQNSVSPGWLGTFHRGPGSQRIQPPKSRRLCKAGTMHTSYGGTLLVSGSWFAGLHTLLPSSKAMLPQRKKNTIKNRTKIRKEKNRPKQRQHHLPGVIF